MVKKQHYIWRKYLSEWTDSHDNASGKLYVLRKELKGIQQRIEFSKIVNIGFQKYYYDISNYTDKDVKILNQLISNMQAEELVKFGLDENILKNASMERDFIETHVMCDSESIDNEYGFLKKLMEEDLSFYEDSKNQKILNALSHRIISSLLGGDSITDEELVNLVKDFSEEPHIDLKYEFNRFFSIQYFRSPMVHENSKKNIKEIKAEKPEMGDINEHFFANMLTVYFAERMALNFTQNFSCSLLLYKNESGIPFITGDTPIICLNGNKMGEINLFHYPISPRYAVELIVMNKNSAAARYSNNISINLSSDLAPMVDSLNAKLAKNCVNEVYSNDKEVLEKMV